MLCTSQLKSIVNQVLKTVCIHFHRDCQVNYTVIIVKLIIKCTQACQWANTPLQAMAQPMDKSTQRKHNLHKSKRSMLEAKHSYFCY